MPPGLCDIAEPGQDVAASSAVSQAIEWLVTKGPGEGETSHLMSHCSGRSMDGIQQVLLQTTREPLRIR
ncbi:hypothetical protein WJX82_007876 [Trebouxia sp. C0006]